MGDVVVVLTAIVCAGALMVFVLMVPGLGLLLLEWWALLTCGAMAALARRQIAALRVELDERGS